MLESNNQELQLKGIFTTNEIVRLRLVKEINEDPRGLTDWWGMINHIYCMCRV